MIDSKAAAGTVGAAAATLLWTLLAAFVDRVAEMGAETLTTVTGATATLLAFAFAYLIPNAASPIPAEQRGGSPEPLTPAELRDVMEAER